jgi:hypothetical protein
VAKNVKGTQHSNSNGNSGKPVVVIGDGWSALAAVGTLLCSETNSEVSPEVSREVRWIAGSISRILSPLPSFETAFGTTGMDGWRQLAQNLGIDLGEEYTGTKLSVHRLGRSRPRSKRAIKSAKKLFGDLRRTSLN